MAPRPTRITLAGRYVRIVPVDPAALYADRHGCGSLASHRPLSGN